MAASVVVLLDNTLHRRAINHHNSNTWGQILYSREDKRHGGLKQKSNRDPYGKDHLKIVGKCLEAVRLDIKHHKARNHQKHSMMDQIPYLREGKRRGDLRLRSSKDQSGLDQRRRDQHQFSLHKFNKEV